MAGHIFVISAPSGTGKTTVVKKLLKIVPKLVLSVSYTTRDPRTGEKDGVDYIFVDEKKFKEMAKTGKFVESAKVHGGLYGTPKRELEANLEKGMDVLLDIDTNGAAKVKEKYPDSVTVFLLPPSFDDLSRRLETRGANTETDILRRISNAKSELERRHEYDYQVVNDKVDEAVDEVAEIISFYRGDV